MSGAADCFDLVKLAQLRRNLREQLQQFFPSVANNALYYNAFFPQSVQCFGIEGVGFVFDFTDGKGLPADAIHQHHHAETVSEASGVHDDVGFGRLREGFPDARPAQMAVDGLAATTVLRGELECPHNFLDVCAKIWAIENIHTTSCREPFTIDHNTMILFVGWVSEARATGTARAARKTQQVECRTYSIIGFLATQAVPVGYYA